MFPRAPAKHCRNCGTATELRTPDDGDTKTRAVCPSCHTIHYENPLNVVGTIPWIIEGGVLKILICQRNIEPRKGFWTLPAGFMELYETTSQGALRETEEEAGAHVKLGGLFTLINVERVGQVHFFYSAELQSTQFNPGIETMAVKLLSEAEMPWDDLAFRTVKETLQRFFASPPGSTQQVHHFDI
ncbi:MAG: NUDIX hydrolase [Burkholderiales bacterium]|nr:MAG: NUDIX hydrolase [Burkholderiales bacterium]